MMAYQFILNTRLHHLKCKVFHSFKNAKDMEIEDVEFTKALGMLQATTDVRHCFLIMNDKRRLGWVRNLDSFKSY
ncbi:hypothetical protein LINPERHAP2_LOCUS3954 [Linum perenne]